jgi:hypothetical protein
MSVLSSWWLWLREYDAPNWFSIAFSLIIWPFFIVWLDKRKRLGVPHLEIILRSSQTIINGIQHSAVSLIFTNRTGSVVYLSRARLREVQKNFPIPIDAAQDILGGWRGLKFINQSGINIEHELILQTNNSAETSIAVNRGMPNAFYSFRPGLWRKLFRRPKYFSIEYIAMVGKKKYSISGVY